MPVGNPPLRYDPIVARAICTNIATTRMGMKSTLRKLKADPKWKGTRIPSMATVHRWLAFSVEFRDISARARELQGDTIIDMALDEAYRSRVGEITLTKETKDGTFSETKLADNVERSKLIVQTLLKRAGQLAPKKYGDRIVHEHTGGATLTLTLPESIAARMEQRMRQAKVIEGVVDEVEDHTR